MTTNIIKSSAKYLTIAAGVAVFGIGVFAFSPGPTPFLTGGTAHAVDVTGTDVDTPSCVTGYDWGNRMDVEGGGYRVCDFINPSASTNLIDNINEWNAATSTLRSQPHTHEMAWSTEIYGTYN